MKTIAAVDGVKNNRILCTIRTEARGTEVEGTLCKIETESQYILGRVGRVNLSNQMHDDASFKTLVMANGQLPFFSGYADIEQTEVEIITCIDKSNMQIAPKKSNPPSGTEVTSVSNEDMQQFVPEKNSLMYTGYLPNDRTVDMSIVNKHYGSDEDGYGFGEAKHRGYFGRNGSGKTVQALTHLAGRLVAHPQLGVLIPDTAGDISMGGHSRAKYKFNFIDLLDRGGRTFEEVEITDVRLASRSTLEKLFVGFLDELGIGSGENLASLSNRVITKFDGDFGIDDFSLDDLLQFCIDEAPKCWSKATGKEKAERLTDYLHSPYAAEIYERRVRKFFTGSRSIKGLINDTLLNGRIILIKMYGLSQDDQQFVMYEIFQNISWQTESAFKKKGDTVNAEIVLDEAPRWVSQGSTDKLAMLIKDAIKTTRKYGLSWTFIGQRIADIDKGVFSQMHTKWFGRGLGTGADRDHMKTELGETGLTTYDTLNYQGGFFWLGVGDEVNLGVGTAHVSMIAYGGDATETIIKKNPLIWR